MIPLGIIPCWYDPARHDPARHDPAWQAAAGGSAELHMYDGMWHVFPQCMPQRASNRVSSALSSPRTRQLPSHAVDLVGSKNAHAHPARPMCALAAPKAPQAPNGPEARHTAPPHPSCQLIHLGLWLQITTAAEVVTTAACSSHTLRSIALRTSCGVLRTDLV